MIVHRISLKKYIGDLSGTGAWLNGGRWNSQYKHLLYTSQSLALAAWEYFVNMDDNFEINLPSYLSRAAISIPGGSSLKFLRMDDLPMDWNSPIHSDLLQELGDQWLDSLETLVLQVPSAVISSEFNYLINPSHPDFHLVNIESVHPFQFDKRSLR